MKEIGALFGAAVLVEPETRTIILQTEPPLKFSVDHPYIKGTRLERAARAAIDAGRTA